MADHGGLAAPHLPGWRVVPDVTTVTIRHFAGDTDARAAVRQLRLAWPDAPNVLTGSDPWLAWRGPKEMIALGIETEALRHLLERLAPGRSAGALAIDISEAIAVIELHGARLDDWLEHLVDAMSIPRAAGRCTRARLGDAAVFLLRLADDRLWLALERPIRAYAEDWLDYAHQGAFRHQDQRAFCNREESA